MRYQRRGRRTTFNEDVDLLSYSRTGWFGLESQLGDALRQIEQALFKSRCQPTRACGVEFDERMADV